MENSKSKIGIYDECYNPVVFNNVRRCSRCLDVGCWTGNTGKALMEKKRCDVDGIDFKAEALEEARKKGYKKTYLVNLNDENFSLNIEDKYDYIICADVLEHLREPDKILRKLRKFLNENGQILISVPNIAFLQFRLELLAGRFDYNPKGGVMDATHLRFFTMKSIKEMCKKSGYKIINCYGYSEVKNRYFFLRPLSKIFPTLFAVQIFLKITHDKR